MNARPILPPPAEDHLLELSRISREAEARRAAERREAAEWHFEEHAWASALGREEDECG